MILGQGTDGKAVRVDVDRLVASRLLLQANSGGGKSWALRRVLEQTHGKVQQLVLDVEGEFHTLREKFDYVHCSRGGAEAPVEAKSAPLLAHKLLQLGISAILDLYELKKHERILVVRRFLEALIEAPKELWHPVLVVIDEAHLFCPQHGEAESAAAVIDLMTRGRKRGFCGVLATQRLSKLHKDAAAEANCKLIGRASQDIDMKRAADELGFTSREDLLRLRSLPAGRFFAFGPGISDVVIEVQVGEVVTTHPRPGAGAAPVPPPREKVQKVLAQLKDLPQEAAAEAKTLAEAKSEIAKLRRELAAKPAAPAPKVERVEVPVLKDAHVATLAKHCDSLAIEIANLRREINVEQVIADRLRAHPARPPARVSPSSPVVPQKAARPAAQETPLSTGERRVLSAIAQHGDAGVTREQLSVLTGYKRSSRDTYLQRLLVRGAVQNGDALVATPDGIRDLGDAFEPLPTGEALRGYWLTRLVGGERKLLEVLVAAHPHSMGADQLDVETGYRRSSRDTYLQKLCARRLVVRVGRGEYRASDNLFDGGGQ